MGAGPGTDAGADTRTQTLDVEIGDNLRWPTTRKRIRTGAYLQMHSEMKMHGATQEVSRRTTFPDLCLTETEAAEIHLDLLRLQVGHSDL